MPAGYRNDPNEALVREIQTLKEQVRALQQKAMWIPVVDLDPVSPGASNIWVFADGRLRIRLFDGTIKEWAAVATPGSGSSGVLKPARPNGGTTRIKQWSATWSKSYNGDGTQRADYPERLWIGNFVGGAPNGNNAALIGFDYTDIQATLVGSTITGVSMYYANASANTADGRIHVYVGTHQNTAAPTTWGNVVSYPVADRWYGASEKAASILPNWVGEELRDGYSYGLLVAGGDGVNVNGWGYGFGTSLAPILEVTYVK